MVKKRDRSLPLQKLERTTHDSEVRVIDAAEQKKCGRSSIAQRTTWYRNQGDEIKMIESLLQSLTANRCHLIVNRRHVCDNASMATTKQFVPTLRKRKGTLHFRVIERRPPRLFRERSFPKHKGGNYRSLKNSISVL